MVSKGEGRCMGGQRVCLRRVIALGITLLMASLAPALAETVPHSLRSDITVRKLLVTATPSASPIRIVKDPRNSILYYLKRSGDIYRVNIAAGTSTLVAGTSQHGLRNTQGMAIGPDGTMYVVGNADLAGSLTQATIAKGGLQAGTRVWSVLAQTVGYPKSNTAYDHRMNAVIVDPTGRFIYVNSGSRTDHGELQTAGGLFPGLRDVGLTACILKLPTGGQNIVLQNDRAWLKNHGYIFAEGVRNTFDMAFDADGNLFGAENGPRRDMPDELNYLSAGRHYGFPWRMGQADNPQQFAGYDPATDKLLNSQFNAASEGYYQNDPTFPPRPAIQLYGSINNYGPDADSFRGPNGILRDASDTGAVIGSFTPHRSPLGLVFDQARVLAPEFRGHGFILSWTPGDPSGATLPGPFNDASQDLLDLKLTGKTAGFAIHATRIVGGFNNPIDAEIIGNKLYVLDFGGTQSVWEVTLPK